VQEEENLERHGIALLPYFDPRYPKLLLEIPQFPPLLYYKGRLHNDSLPLAVVGTRQMSSYGKHVTEALVNSLVARGVSIVSGLAYGVDATAHKAALDCKARTIAVLGCGLDEASLYPQAHLQLASEIVQNGGLLVSEYPPRTAAFKQHFVARNRIISGLSLGTLVVEAGESSGALITAHHALEQNRTVFAVPGPITSAESMGPNQLISQGAVVVRSAEDIFRDFNIPETVQEIATPEALSETEQKVLEALSKVPITTTELIKHLSWEPGMVGATLTFLEMKGVVKHLGNQQYIRTKKL
jgi:DNA processing protein